MIKITCPKDEAKCLSCDAEIHWQDCEDGPGDYEDDYECNCGIVYKITFDYTIYIEVKNDQS